MQDALILNVLYALVFLLGLLVGSFILEMAFRIPRNEDFVFTRSHCEACGHVLSPLDLIPVLSFVFLQGKCRCCGHKLSILYPLAELIHAVLWLSVFIVYRFTTEAVIFALFFSALLCLSLIDAKTGIIPPGFPFFIGLLGGIRLIWQVFIYQNRDYLLQALLGTVSISLPLIIVYIISKASAIGGGDIKLMAAAGFLIGWRPCLLGFLLACILGSVIHVIRIRFFNAGRVLYMGPYLSAGLILSMLFGEVLMQWYFSLFLT